MDEREADREFEYRAGEVIKRQRFQRRPKTAQELLSRVIARRGFAATKQNDHLEKIWLETVGKGLASQTRIGSIRKGKLQVFVHNTPAKQHLTMLKPGLVGELKQRIDGLDDIQIRTGN